MKAGDLVRSITSSKLVEAGRPGEVMSVYEYPNVHGGLETHYKVRFEPGVLCVVRASDVEGALGAGA